MAVQNRHSVDAYSSGYSGVYHLYNQPSTLPWLSGANFSNTYLSGTDLRGTDVTAAELTGAFLVCATMPDGSIAQETSA